MGFWGGVFIGVSSEKLGQKEISKIVIKRGKRGVSLRRQMSCGGTICEGNEIVYFSCLFMDVVVG